MAQLVNEKKRVRDDSSESDSDSVVAKRFRDDLLEILDDSEVNTATQDLASVMKSFEEEISIPNPSNNTDLTSESGESQPELGYLFEASDDELGLPPAFSGSSSSEEEENLKKEENDVISVPSFAVGLDQIWKFEDEISSYDEFAICGDENSEFLALDGLFDYSDMYNGHSDFSDFSYRVESLHAL
ncbi:hypothetical protein IFM89_020467 [Coptis chinensis]|uniref:Uncharacterized protein n=1 Tax=Coptis chinensis TaxID=261450 RepID=A0A835LMY0_9MAGN|nr:hypothetical protein IFM89_020467 [Coptis chinensis]